MREVEEDRIAIAPNSPCDVGPRDRARAQMPARGEINRARSRRFMWAYTRSAYLRLRFSHPQTKLRARPICQRMAARQAGTGNRPPRVLYPDLLDLRITQSSSRSPGFL